VLYLGAGGPGAGASGVCLLCGGLITSAVITNRTLAGVLLK
jgi:hypothetical protein